MHSDDSTPLSPHVPDESSAGRAPPSLSTAQTIGQYSQFMRSAVADEESLQVGESLQALAVQIEALVGMLQLSRGTDPARLATALIDLVGDLRTHRALLLGVGVDWHRFFEFDAHFSALNQFRILVTQWAMEAAPPNRQVPVLADFDLAAWRLLGAGSLLLDVYEQSKLDAAPYDEELQPLSTWSRWRAWWMRQRIKRQVVRKEGRRGRRRTD
ncbi:MAG: hypothetical protein IPF38_16725 [Burkholderiales bacterium]|jgi:hypothetical protein|uniref:hypothetical protein n=1 Tax=Candidatus Aalborgicola defluviihabitans TaxID=3386187 RepID=UPI001D5BA1BE|nr:hypothetical protein [Burkholderiales bacterium]MBK6570813.1 hypothetical protein [Burkholderiales bacterium]MBL0243314.1 hypothetical protein [Rhodoferax sp.]